MRNSAYILNLRSAIFSMIIIIFYLILYIISTGAQSYLNGKQWFRSSLGPSSVFTVWIGHLGLDTIPLIIDSIILFVVLHGINLSGLRRVLALTVVTSVVISLIASFIYTIIAHAHELNAYKLNNEVAYSSIVIDLCFIVLPLCIRLNSEACLSHRALITLTYVNALIVSYMIDVIDSTTLITLHQAPVIGGAGPLDGLVANPLLTILLALAVSPLINYRIIRSRARD